MHSINIKTSVVILILTVLFFVISIKGISSNHSYWSDEAFVSSVARNIILGNTNLSSGISLIGYQSMQLFSTIVSFKIFGMSEWASRFPSILWGSIGVIFCFLLSKKLSNFWGGALSAFLYTILQVNHAYSTQAKPYSALETITLIVFYFSVKVSQDIKNKYFHILIIFFGCLATLYNFIGLFTFIPYLVIIFPIIINRSFNRKIIPLLAMVFVFLFFWITKIYTFLPLLFKPSHNWTIYFKELFWRQFGLFTLPAIFGIFTIKNKKILLGIIFSASTLLYAWTFVQYTHNIRYLMPIIGLLVVFFGVFWGKTGEVVFKKPALICLIVALLIYVGGYKIIRKPAVYYTPNADFYGDIQTADFKVFFQKWREKYPDFEKYPIYAGPFDSLSWYTNRYPTATFNKFTKEPTFHPEFGYTEYSRLSDFIELVNKNQQGFVMIHDWESYMPDEIKDYVKRNMKLELRVESMAVSPNDKWPLALYSWGFDKK